MACRQTVMREAPRIILASASPRRRALLAEMGLAFDVIEPHVDESLDGSPAPADAARLLAERKAEHVAATLDDGIVIGADTVVSLDGEIIGKPSDHADAVAILSRLRDSDHSVITGVCVIDVGSRRKIVEAAETWIHMRHISDDEIERYVTSGEAMGMAGAYAVQETGDRYIESMDGSFTNVVGLPVELLRNVLQQLGHPL